MALFLMPFSLFIRSSLLCLVLGQGMAQTELAVVQVVSDAKLRLAIVDSARLTPARTAVHEAFTASLRTAMEQVCGGPVVIEAKCQNADQAAFGLDAGACQVVLVIGKALPRPLVRSEMERLHATLGAEKKQRKVYLVFTTADEGLKKILTASFAVAVTDGRFLDAFDGGIENTPEPTEGQKLASAGP